MLILFFGMAVVILSVWLLSNTESLFMLPLTTPDQFLSNMPYLTFSISGKDVILIQPSSTILVYLLGLIMIAIGVYFLVTKRNHQSRYYWAIGLILWGISAIVAGTSYQAFGYELKCRGLEHCLFTSNFELAYMLLTAFCINFLVAGTGYTSTGIKGRQRLMKFAVIDSTAYSVYMFVGAVLPVKFLISYEGFMAFIGVNFLIMFILNILHYKKHRDKLNLKLIYIWIGFLIVNIGYFIFLLGGFGSKLYLNFGIWFNENDALHVLLILWACLIFVLLRKELSDIPENSPQYFGSVI